MSYGVVIRMDNGWSATPNQGIVRDLETDIEYPFYRPAVSLGTTPTTDWTIKVHDIISFTIVDGIATVPVLYRKGDKEFVITKI